MAEGVFDFYSFLMGGLSAEPHEALPYEPLEFPLETPNVGGLRSLIFYSDFYTMSSESPFNGKRQTYRSSGERWRATLELAKMTRRQAGLWEGFLLNLQGGYQSFLFGDVFHSTPLGSALGTPRIKGAGQLGRTIETDGWTANQWGALYSGDNIQINGRLHKVTRDINSDADGNATLEVFPSVSTPTPDDLILPTSDCKGIFTLASPIQMLSQINITGIREGLTFEIVEVI
jgi:hypothetical protein